MPQFIYTMKGLGKVHPPDHQRPQRHLALVLSGAKIGVLGLNGAGKSTLLKIMAGVDKEFVGEAFPAEGITVGFLPQEPQLDPAKTCAATSRKAWRRVRALLDALRRDQREARRGPVARRDGQGARRAGAAAGPDRRGRTPGSSTRSLELAMDALRCPPARRRRHDAVGRRAAPRRAVPAAAAVARTCCCSTSRPTISTPSRWPGSSASSRTIPGTVVAVTHDRYFLDNVAGWILELDRGTRHPVGRQLLVVARAEAAAARARREGRVEAPAHAAARARVDPHVAPRPPGQGQGAPQRLRAAAQRGHARRRSTPSRSTSRRARGSATSSSRRGACARATATRC